MLSSTPVLGDDLRRTHAAIGALLQKDGGGLVPLRSACPTKNADPWEYADGSQIVAINDKDSAVLVDTHQCAGGNKHGQYLAIVQNDVARVVTDAEIDDMSFLGQGMRAPAQIHHYGSSDTLKLCHLYMRGP
jgi:hypothetical protein